MGFYTLSDGNKADGSPEHAFAKPSLTIPDGTMAKAKIMDAELKSFDWGKHYEVKWCLQDTSSKGLYVTQKIRAFDENPGKRDRAVQMLVCLFKAVNYTPSHDEPPSDEDLAQIKGRVAGITIQQWFFNGKEGNWVSEVYSAESFKSIEGTMKSAPASQSISPSSPPPPSDSFVPENFKDDDIDF